MKTRLSLLAAAAAALFAAAPQADAAAPYVRHRVIVGYAYGSSKADRAAVAKAAGTVGGSRMPKGARLVRTRRGETVQGAIARLRRDPRVRYAVPDYIAHASGFIPNDTGNTDRATLGGWQQLQWNFTGPYGVDAPDAWSEAIAAGAPGGRGVEVAVLDTGVAFENHGRFRRDPDLYSRHRYTAPYDFVDHDKYPDDENGHGTHVTGTIAQRTNNAFGATGLAYGVTIMPLRVLDAHGEGDASDIAHAITYAADHGAQVLNMSLEFDSSITASEIPDIVKAVRYAHGKGAVVVGAAGNAAETAVAYPARTSHVISVGGTTQRGCEAEYSNSGRTLAVVAPGGGDDALLEGDAADAANCHPDEHGDPVFQVTYLHDPLRDPRSFGFPDIYEGTSMACPHVSAIAALIIATKVIGAHPTPDAIEQRIKDTATDLGKPGRDSRYGSGLVNAARAIDPTFVPGQQQQPPAAGP